MKYTNVILSFLFILISCKNPIEAQTATTVGVDFNKLSETSNNNNLNVIDLFAGCGGMSLGFKWAGFNSILATDIDENAISTYSHNFPNVSVINDDLRDIEKIKFDEMIKNNSTRQ